MPRNSRNPIEARGRIANFRAKPIGIINLAGDVIGVTPNSHSADIVTYLKKKQVPRTYATDVAKEWYLDNVFLPDEIERLRKFGNPIGAESSKDKIGNYPRPIQDKMIEKALDYFFDNIGLPEVHEVVDPFWLDGKIVAPGDLAVGYGVKYIKEGISENGAFFKLAILRYDWMPNDEESLMKLYNKYTQQAFYSADADAAIARYNKSQSELQKEGKSIASIEQMKHEYVPDENAFITPETRHGQERIRDEIVTFAKSGSFSPVEVLYFRHESANKPNDRKEGRLNKELFPFVQKCLDFAVAIAKNSLLTHTKRVYDEQSLDIILSGEALGVWLVTKDLKLDMWFERGEYESWQDASTKVKAHIPPSSIIVGIPGFDSRYTVFQQRVGIVGTTGGGMAVHVDVDTPFFLIFPANPVHALY